MPDVPAISASQVLATSPPTGFVVPMPVTTTLLRLICSSFRGLGGLAELVNEVTGIDADDVQLDKSFTDDLDVDSLSMVEVVVAAEEKFGVTIPDDEVKNLKTVGDAVSFIENAQG